MKIGRTFGMLFGALLHPILRYCPLKIGKNRYLNLLKGALVGIPGGVCASYAVPVACGGTHGKGRVEVALRSLCSSLNFNPVVVMMTFRALPRAMSLTRYAILLFVILFVVPTLIRWDDALEESCGGIPRCSGRGELAHESPLGDGA
jgi:uncharacterized membrane protein YraQ (UPF0718 family)